MFVMALQGMKPHHAAKSWNFMNFQSSNYAAVQMEFTTPKSYANTKVNIGIVTDNEKSYLPPLIMKLCIWIQKLIQLDGQFQKLLNSTMLIH